ncbi:MAG: carboxylating nicotinate-nucleotide diphosphorylase [Crocinitomicaceae bacterium]|nr:carboxylating nicotinate-nucleotide diphosphorylase [Crocinitomicaceae bacterium]
MDLNAFIKEALNEDIGDGDHTSLACFPNNAIGKANLISKDIGIIAGIELAKKIICTYDDNIYIETFKKDGDEIQIGDLIFSLNGPAQSILSIERLFLNCMQRMSGIASQTAKIKQLVAHTDVTILDTRKTTPLFREIEKWAVRIGGGQNHRFGLFDMVMIKDNHVDFSGGIKNAIISVKKYLEENNKNLKIEVEVRNQSELEEAIQIGGVDRILFDNFSPAELNIALAMVPNNIETEASGGITIETIKEYAETGVQFISVGALTHSYKSIDLSLKANF